MVKHIILPILAVVVFIFLVSFFIKKSSQPGFKLPTVTQSHNVVTINDKSINVEVANNKDSRAQGLSERDSLATDSGMLFMFDAKGVKPLFWMKGMRFPLDIIWITDGKIVSINKNVPVPAPDTPDRNLPVYSSEKPIDFVLEVNSGFCEQNGIKVGDGFQMQFDPTQS